MGIRCSFLRIFREIAWTDIPITSDTLKKKNEFFILEIIRFYLEVKDRVSGFSKNAHAIKHAGLKLRTVRGTYSGNTRV